MNDLIISVIGSLISALIYRILCIDAYKEHKEIYHKLMCLKRDFKDPNNTNPINPDVNLIGKQLHQIKELSDKIIKMQDIHPFFSFIFNYSELHRSIVLLFEYNRNQIMLPEQKFFEDDYRMDLNKAFKKTKLLMKIHIRLYILIFILMTAIFIILKIVK